MLPADPAGRPLREAVAQIDRVHGDGSLPTIAVRRLLLATQEGYFDARPPYEIGVGIKAAHPNLTMLHETGHVLDYLGLGTPGELATANLSNPLLQVWRTTAEGSNAVQRLRWLEATHPATRLQMQASYLLRYHEVWARSYAQFVAHRTGDPTLVDQLGARRIRVPGATYLPQQWDDDDFAPIASAIEQVFRDLGWII